MLRVIRIRSCRSYTGSNGPLKWSNDLVKVAGSRHPFGALKGRPMSSSGHLLADLSADITSLGSLFHILTTSVIINRILLLNNIYSLYTL